MTDMRLWYLTLLVFMPMLYSQASLAGGLVASNVYIEVQLYPALHNVDSVAVTQGVSQTYDTVMNYIPRECAGILSSESIQICQSESLIFQLDQDSKISKLTIAPI